MGAQAGGLRRARWNSSTATRAIKGYVDGIGEATAQMIEAERERSGPYRSLFHFAQRTGLRRERIEHLTAVGAFDDFGLRRRELLWQLGLLSLAAVGPQRSSIRI